MIALCIHIYLRNLAFQGFFGFSIYLWVAEVFELPLCVILMEL